jgi:hypothetical protein
MDHSANLQAGFEKIQLNQYTNFCCLRLGQAIRNGGFPPLLALPDRYAHKLIHIFGGELPRPQPHT